MKIFLRASLWGYLITGMAFAVFSPTPAAGETSPAASQTLQKDILDNDPVIMEPMEVPIPRMETGANQKTGEGPSAAINSQNLTSAA